MIKILKTQVLHQTDYGNVWDTVYFVEGVGEGFTVSDNDELEQRTQDIFGQSVIPTKNNIQINYRSGSVERVLQHFMECEQQLQSQAELTIDSIY